ncbi:MAG: PQQ-binding-like beta-propeller repeat protein [Planctomycetaceae bacterium]|nr:PQQ-binding-like beta-propeller repeat protein [Planctomycetaceae bacterium]
MKRFASLLIVLFFSIPADAENWPQFRGPHFNGSSDESNLPEQWSTSDGVAWVVDLPGASAATPAVWNDHVFISSTDLSGDKLLALCFDRKSGKQLWSREIASGIRRDSRSNFAAPSPATNGKEVIFFYGTGDLVAFDFEGDPLWRRNLQKDYGDFTFLWTFSTSPLLYDGKLYMQVLQRDTAVDGRGFTDRKNDSYLLAVDPANGKTLWRQVRPSEARSESLEAFSTPVPFEHKGRKEVLVIGGDDVTGHDPETGKELWRWGTWNPDRIGHWRLVPSPVAGDGIILACAPKKDPIYAVNAGGEGRLKDDDLAWVSRTNREISSDVPTPAFAEGDFFILSDVRNALSRVDPKSGKVHWSVSLPRGKKYEASPLVADGKVYLINFIGDVIVVDADSGKLISKISMDEPTDDDPVRSSIVAAHGQLFIRTSGKLYCIGDGS